MDEDSLEDSLRSLGKLFIALIVLFTAGAAGLFWLMSPSALDAESAAYVDDAAVAISSHWSKGELLYRATPDLAKYMSMNPKNSTPSSRAPLPAWVLYAGTEEQPAGHSFPRAANRRSWRRERGRGRSRPT